MRKSQKRIWQQLIALTIMHGANHALMVVLFLSPFFPEMCVDLGVENPAKVQLLSTFNLLAYALASFPMGLLGDRYPKATLLTVSMVFNGLAIAGLGLIKSYGALLVLCVVAGITGGGFHPVSQALITELMPDKKGKGLGIMGIGASLGYISAPIIADRAGNIVSLGDLFSWQNASVVLGIIGLIVAILYGTISRRGASFIEVEKKATPEWSDFPWKFVVTMVLVFGLRDMIGYGIYPLASGYYQEDLGIDRGLVAFFLSLYYIPGLVVQPFFGATSDSLRRERIVVPALGIMALALFSTPWLAKVSPALPILLLGGAMSSTVPTIDAFVADGVPEEHRARTFGLLFAFGIGLGSLGPLILGHVSFRMGFSKAYFMAGFIPLMAGAIIWRVAKIEREFNNIRGNNIRERRDEDVK